ncbi:lysR-family transcriptional regulatory protein [Streptomyces sp. PAMC 26508]|uniref:LysR family transcriptional regulator substrate-binding protein n=1 Tax=Streptomyces sp. PAMC 26508 TaxID=1265601 RepID=UPI0002C6B53E|nr:LysR family transcriptional regulator substrate-binding protein [Streptomyces sp. PAMC 26508]AGJ53190.1 lysR-family transcriptional regulatory protein [Streptomyces sp. PAMC 26508]
MDILEDSYGATLRSLRTGRVDLHLAELPVDEPDIVVGPTVCTAARALAVPAGHPLASRDTVSLEDLALAPLIRPADVPQVFLDAHFPQHTPGGRPVPAGPVARSWQDFLTLVGAGDGRSSRRRGPVRAPPGAGPAGGLLTAGRRRGARSPPGR